MTSTMPIGALATLLGLVAESSAQFIVPDSRGAAGTVVAEWDRFSSAAGPNRPDGLVLIEGEEPDNLTDFDAFDSRAAESGSFRTTTGNLYAFATEGFGDGVIAPRIEVPSPETGYGFRSTVLVQVRTFGVEPDPASFAINVQDRSESFERLAEFDLGPDGIGGGTELYAAVTFIFPRARGVNEVEFIAESSSMSLVEVIVDVRLEPLACPVDRNQDGDVNYRDLFPFLRDADLGLSSSGDPALGDGDWNGDGQLTPADYQAFLAAIANGCPDPANR